jgi:formamidopyrimidine-DNA glycosylase
LGKRLKSSQIESTERQGKYLCAFIDNGTVLVLHFGMTGFLNYYHSNETPPKHERVAFHFNNGYNLGYHCQRLLGQVRLEKSIDELQQKEDLGIDALSGNLDEETFLQLAQEKNGSLKSFLMDQSTISGIGNVYSNEILFQLGFHPKIKIDDLNETDLKKTFQTMHDVLETVIDRFKQEKPMPDDYLSPHYREDNTCPKCNSKIETVKVTGRTAYYCPQCQS